MKILVTGGNGYIGSHTVVELVEQGHSVVIADNFINSKKENLKAIEKLCGKEIPFYKVDVCDKDSMYKVFFQNNFDAVIHFAGLKAVGESVRKPLEYYRNNITSTLNLIELCDDLGVDRFVFSSSATVYGEQPSPLHEELPLMRTTNPYGETKAMSERILEDAAKANPNLEVTLLRYFNPVGAHKSGLIGEDPQGIPNNLMPYIQRVAKGTLKELSVFGDDYDTVDGTGVRDYIHVVDLAKGHVAALQHSKPGINVYNLGTGHGTSVLELVKAFKEENKIKIPFTIVERRPGDLDICFADASKAKRELNWETTRTIEDMVKDAWNYEKNK